MAEKDTSSLLIFEGNGYGDRVAAALKHGIRNPETETESRKRKRKRNL